MNAWFQAAYDPILDRSNKVVGMVYFGHKEDQDQAVRHQIQSAKVGTTGYIFVLNSNGRYILSKDGKRDGESIWETKDAAGQPMVQRIIQIARGLKPGEIGEHQYLWLNPGDPAPRKKLARIAYFAPWDWVIGVSSYEDEFLAAVNRLDTLGRRNTWLILALTVGVLAASIAASLWFALKVSRQLRTVGVSGSRPAPAGAPISGPAGGSRWRPSTG